MFLVLSFTFLRVDFLIMNFLVCFFRLTREYDAIPRIDTLQCSEIHMWSARNLEYSSWLLNFLWHLYSYIYSDIICLAQFEMRRNQPRERNNRLSVLTRMTLIWWIWRYRMLFHSHRRTWLEAYDCKRTCQTDFRRYKLFCLIWYSFDGFSLAQLWGFPMPRQYGRAKIHFPNG